LIISLVILYSSLIPQNGFLSRLFRLIKWDGLKGKPEVIVESSFDFGLVPTDAQIWHRFRVENRTDRAVKITRILPLCACFKVTNKTDSVILPYQSGSFEVLLNTTGFYGRLTKYLYLDTDEDRILITVKARISADLDIKSFHSARSYYLIITLPDSSIQVIDGGGHLVWPNQNRLYIDLRSGTGQITILFGGKKMTLPLAKICHIRKKRANLPGWHTFAHYN